MEPSPRPVFRAPGVPGVALAVMVAAWAALALGACGGGRASNPFSDEGRPGSDDLRIYIDNQSFDDVRVYALTSRGAQSLGLVTSTQHKSVQIAWHQLDQIAFRLEVLAGRSYRTQSITASPGEHLELIIPSDPGNAFVRPGRGGTRSPTSSPSLPAAAYSP